MRCLWMMLVAFALALVAGAAPTSATVSLPPDFADEPVTPLAAPTALAFTPDGRMLITTQPGRLRILAKGGLLGTPAIDLSAKLYSGSERGLLGVAVDPGFALYRYVYLFYTWNKFGSCATNSPSSPVNRVSRFTLPDSNLVDPASEQVLIDNMPSPNGTTTGGDLEFGRDGNLYVTIGDGGCDYAGGGCAGSNDAARDEHVLTGKVLRVAADGGIPADNPYRGPTARAATSPVARPGQAVPGDVCLGAAQPVPIRLRSERGGHPPVRQRRTTTTTAARDAPRSPGGAFVPNGVWPAPFEGAYLFADYVCGSIFRLVPQAGGSFTRTTFASGLGASVHRDAHRPRQPRRQLRPRHRADRLRQHPSRADDLLTRGRAALRRRGDAHAERERHRPAGRGTSRHRPPLDGETASRHPRPPLLRPDAGQRPTIAGPAPEDLAATTNSYLDVSLTATDSQGLSATVTRRVDPKLVNLTFATKPSGLTLELSGTSFAAPRTFASWEGYDLTVSAANQGRYLFSSWSDGGAATHSIRTPPSARTYTATFRKGPRS